MKDTYDSALTNTIDNVCDVVFDIELIRNSAEDREQTGYLEDSRNGSIPDILKVQDR